MDAYNPMNNKLLLPLALLCSPVFAGSYMLVLKSVPHQLTMILVLILVLMLKQLRQAIHQRHLVVLLVIVVIILVLSWAISNLN